jgi:20S proteasome subunit beta 7
MAKTQNAKRLKIIPGTSTVLGASGEYSDFQKIYELLEQKALEETTTNLMDDLYADTSHAVTAASTWNYLRMVMYTKRSKMNPYWNDLVVAGTDEDGKPFLGMVDKIGTTIQDKFIATGYGGYLAMPLLREKWHPNMTEGEARALLEDCMKILFYRDCRASSKMQLAKVSVDGVALVSDPYQLENLQWDAPSFAAHSGDLDLDGGW